MKTGGVVSTETNPFSEDEESKKIKEATDIVSSLLTPEQMGLGIVEKANILFGMFLEVFLSSSDQT